MRIVGAIAAIALLGCAPAAPATPPAKASGTREAARVVLQEYCGACHHPTGATPKPEAMAIFDLSHEIFEAPMKAENYAGMIGRLDGFGVPADGQKTIRAFVEEYQPE